MAAYIVAELAETGWSLDPIEGLTAAKYHAAARAKEVGRAVVVRAVETGLEVARFSPSPQGQTPAPPPPGHRRPSSDALIRLRVANQRLQALVGSQSSSRVKKDSGGL